MLKLLRTLRPLTYTPSLFSI